MKVSKLFLCLAAIIGLVLFTPPAAKASFTNIYIDSFQNIDWSKELTGEIYWKQSSSSSLKSFSFCVDTGHNMSVPANYYKEAFSIAGNQGRLEAAYLMDTYAPSKHGAFSGSTDGHAWNSDVIGTGTALQLAIWDVTGQSHMTLAQVGSQYAYLYDKAAELKLGADSAWGPDGHALAGLANSYQFFSLWADSAKLDKKQDILAPVPLPPSMFLLGAGLVGLVGVRRRMR